MEDFVIQNEDVVEFDYENFELFHNRTKDVWSIEFYDETDCKVELQIDTDSFDYESELFNRLGLQKEEFEKIQEFENERS